jgi:probable HAF family extracellular repeat protein
MNRKSGGGNMKSKKTTSVVVMTIFAALAMPVDMAAQNNPSQQHKPKHQKYRLFDTGTFGGLASAGPGIGNGGPIINGNGAVVGGAETTVPLPSYSNGFSCFGPNVGHALRWQDGQSTDLGALSPSDNNCSNAQAINDSGDIAGTSENGVIDPLVGLIEMRAVLWMNGKIIDLGTFGGNQSGAFSINNKREIAGFALNTVPDPFSLFDLGIFGSSNGTQTRAFVRRNGKMKDLGTLGGPDAFANNVNERGQVAGQSYTNSTPNPTTGIPTVDPFLWENGRMIDLGSLGGTLGGTSAINSRGQVVGSSNLPGDNFAHGFLWDGSVLKDLGTFGGDTSEADSLNDAGEVVGSADFPGDQLHDGFLWRKGVMIDLGNLGMTSRAYSINSKSQVVGNSRLSDGITIHSFLWERGEMVDLNNPVSPKSDVVLLDVNSIADSGEILVNGLPSGCGDEGACGHAYVMIPDGDCDDDCENAFAPRCASAITFPARQTHRAIRFDCAYSAGVDLPIGVPRPLRHLNLLQVLIGDSAPGKPNRHSEKMRRRT